MSKSTIYIISAVALIILAFIFFIAYRLGNLKRLKNKEIELEKQRNLIISTPIMSELAKIEVILKNEKLEEKLKQWQERYEIIKNERYNVITDKLFSGIAPEYSLY